MCFAQLRIALSDSILAIKQAGGNAIYLNLCGPVCDGCGGHPGITIHHASFMRAQPIIAAAMGW